jgi:Fur family ferric uptake transcriptional regulator
MSRRKPNPSKPTVPFAATPASMAPLCSVFRRFLKSEGQKYTKERADVLDAIIALDDVFEAEELLLRMRSAGHDVSKATIYRTLKLLVDAGIITQALFDSKQAHYRLIYGQDPKHSMVCMKTGKHVEFSSPELTRLRDRICRELGWEPVGHRFEIYAVSPGASGREDDHERDQDRPGSSSDSGSSGRPSR